ncbi:tyrosine-protein kinase SRK3-like, partial [Clarias magur]
MEALLLPLVLTHELLSGEWYYGNINRQKAEKLLLAPQNKTGSFLVRISESHSDEYTISARSETNVFHFRIQRSSVGAYFVSDKISFATLDELIRYYQNNPKILGCPLDQPCVQQRELFDMEPWERPREEFKLVKKLGEGHFGEVWEAVWTTKDKKVAIKMLKQEDTKLDEFVKEVHALKNLHHPKLIQLLALCTRGEPVYIITELMTKGSLKSYLASPEGQVLTSAHLIYMAGQVAEGMAYLEDRHIVHRDLAARNILVGSDLECKVADFGLARIIK